MPPGDNAASAAGPAHAALDALLSRPAGEVFEALARRALGKPGDLVSLLAPLVGTPHPRYATIDDNPGGREWWRARRRSGAPQTPYRDGRKPAALWSDCEALLRAEAAEASPPEAPATKPQTLEDADRASLEAMGVLLQPANRRAAR